jgi:hypothetical protein
MLYITIKKNRADAYFNLPILNLEKIDVYKMQKRNAKINVTFKNTGKDGLEIFRIHNYVFYAQTNRADPFRVYSKAELQNGDLASVSFEISNELVFSEQTFYCSKVWYSEQSTKKEKVKECFYKLKNANGKIERLTLAPEVVSEFQNQATLYEKEMMEMFS